LTVGDFGGIDKSTVSRTIKQVSIAIALLRNEFIHMPKSRNEIISMFEGFYKIAKFPNVVGTIDCTHVKMQSPGKIVNLS
jgi:hypothetical protein